MRIQRLADMIEGSFCPVMIDGSVKHKEVKRAAKGLYIRISKNIVYEADLPLGEEVTI